MCRSPTRTSTTRRSPTTERARDPGLGRRRPRLDRLGARRVRLPRLRRRRRLLLESVLLGARADREPRLARRALPAALGRVRRGGAGARLRGRGDGDVPLRDRVRRPRAGDALGRWAELAARRRGPRRRGDLPRDHRRARAQGRRPAPPLRAGQRDVRLAGLDRPAVPHRPPARIRDHVDRPARGRGGRRHPRRAHETTRAGGRGRLMLGPGVVWYLGISAFLFGTGALGVLVRRNPLIVLLSLEIMLNGANLALIAFSRSAGNGAGQIFALAVMAVAASEVVVGLGLVVALSRRRAPLDVDRMNVLRG